MQSTGTLYICPTPIGNLEDITLRVIRILKEVDIIACEDTRVTQKLLNHYNIKAKLTSYHKFSEKEKSRYIINLLKEGQNIALVSDAGTPLISDPGFELIKHAYENNIKVIPLPGASAVITALSVSYLKDSHFVFIGFLPKTKKEKEAILTKYQETNIVFYESPNRLVDALHDISEILHNRTAIVARELTKIHEEINRNTVDNLITHYKNNPPKGEIAVIIEGVQQEESTPEEKEIIEKIQILSKAGYSTKEISKILALLTNIPKSRIYDLVITTKQG